VGDRTGASPSLIGDAKRRPRRFILADRAASIRKAVHYVHRLDSCLPAPRRGLFSGRGLLAGGLARTLQGRAIVAQDRSPPALSSPLNGRLGLAVLKFPRAFG
jgi:hypothetical protein